MKLDIGDWEQKLTNTIEGFGEALERQLLSLKNPKCTEVDEDSFWSK